MQPDLLQRIAAPLRALLEQRLLAVAPRDSADALASLLDLGGLAVLGFVLAASCRASHAEDSVAAGAHARRRHPRRGWRCGARPLRVDRAPPERAVRPHLHARGSPGALRRRSAWRSAPLPSVWRKLVLAALSLDAVAPVRRFSGRRAGCGDAGLARRRVAAGAVRRPRAWLHALVQGAFAGRRIRIRPVGTPSQLRCSRAAGGTARLRGVAAHQLRHRWPWRHAAPDSRTTPHTCPSIPGRPACSERPEVFRGVLATQSCRARHDRLFACAPRRSVEGALLRGVALLVPGSLEAVLASPSPLVAWACSAVVFIREASARR